MPENRPDDSPPIRPAVPARAWQRMLSGRRLDLLQPAPADIDITDIAHGLARVARWNGQTLGEHAFSVAQHSLVVEEIVRDANAYAQICCYIAHNPAHWAGDCEHPEASR